MPVHALNPYFGARTDWLPCVGGYPHDLRPGGWIYLRCDDAYGARARVTRLEWREERPYRTGTGDDGFGPGLVFVIEPQTWDEFGQPLGDDADYVHQGYRYHRRRRDGELVRLSASDRVPDEDWED